MGDVSLEHTDIFENMRPLFGILMSDIEHLLNSLHNTIGHGILCREYQIARPELLGGILGSGSGTRRCCGRDGCPFYSFEKALSTAAFYRLSEEKAANIVEQITTTVAGSWYKLAGRYGLSEQYRKNMAPAFGLVFGYTAC